jgi:crotonobetainyl-CoA:carnitine CoA-transferase CaiB-like acyl-CoA transferase
MSESGPEGALEALTILDLCQGGAGPIAARLFAGYGARVIKVERPRSGDTARHEGPYVGGVADLERSVPFLAFNAGKLSLTLDYETPDGAAVLRRLCEEADGLIEDEPTLRRDELGLGAADLIAHVPRLVIVTVDAAGFELSASQHLIGLQAFVAALAGLWSASQTEHGQVIHVAGGDALVSLAAAAPVRIDAALPDLDSLRLTNLVREVQHPVAGLLTCAAPPLTMSAAPSPAPRCAPLLGEHSDYVLHDLVGLETTEIEALREQGIV